MVSLWKVLRTVPLRDRARLVIQALSGRRDFVVLGSAPDVAPTASALQTMRPGTVVFRPEISEAWPLWAGSEDGGTPQRELLPLPEQLKHRIDDWAHRWNGVMYDNLYEWPDDVVRNAFDREAREICADMQAALGDGWRVEYGGVDS